MSFGGETVANALLTSLMLGEDITLPTIDLNDPMFTIPGDTNSALYQTVTPITNAMLTEQQITGQGVFDVIMGGFRSQLVEEFNKGRISGAEYTKAFVALTESAMSNAVQFLIQRDQAFWQGAQAQAQAITARVNLATAKVQYAGIRLEAMTNRANYALTKLRLATEDAQYGQVKYQVDYLLPSQYNTSEYNLTNILPKQANLLTEQISEVSAQVDTLAYQLANILPAQLSLTNEQKEAQRAQTLNTRSDGVPVVGLLGKQRDLYTQQITSYQRDAEVKAIKVFTDAWSVRYTTAEPEDAPVQLNGVNMDTLFTKIKTLNGL